MQNAGLLGEDQALGDLCHEDEQVVPLVWEVIMEQETAVKIVTKIEELYRYAKDIISEWIRRLIQSDLQSVCT